MQLQQNNILQTNMKIKDHRTDSHPETIPAAFSKLLTNTDLGIALKLLQPSRGLHPHNIRFQEAAPSSFLFPAQTQKLPFILTIKADIDNALVGCRQAARHLNHLIRLTGEEKRLDKPPLTSS